MKRKKKNKLWMLQAVLCAVCILSVVLLYQNYVVIPRQNRELVEELKTCFPEDIPPGGGSPGEKEEQAGREPEVSAVDLRSLQRQYPGVRGWLTIPEVGIDYPVMQSSREDPEYYLRRDYRGNYDINGSLFLQADCILGESGNLTIYGHNMNSGAMFGNLDQYAQGVLSDTGRDGGVPDSGSFESRCVHVRLPEDIFSESTGIGGLCSAGKSAVVV